MKYLIFKNLMSVSIDFDYTSKYKDFDETRVKNRFFIEPENFEIQLEFKSNLEINLFLRL